MGFILCDSSHVYRDTTLANPNWGQSKHTLGIYNLEFDTCATRVAQSYIVEISQKVLNLRTKTPCALYRPPWALTTEYKLTWLGISYHMATTVKSHTRATRAAHSILQPMPEKF